METLPFSQRPGESPRGTGSDDALWEFHSEVPEPSRTDWAGVGRWLLRVATVAALVTAAVWVYRTRTIAPPVEGTLRIESDPRGAAVEIDGQLRGLTPFTATLPAGAYRVLVVEGGRHESIAARVAAGVETVHHVRLPDFPLDAPLPPPTTGRLRVLSEPAGALVAIDDADYGAAPVTIDDLEPGQHQIRVQNGDRTYTRDVLIEAGTTESIVVTGPPAVPATGWLQVNAATPLEVLEGGHVIGASGQRILLGTGTYDVEVAAEALGFSATRRVTIGAGMTTTVPVDLPQSTININAEPWADVWIDGAPVGQTPIANLVQTIGSHDVQFRHPELGTRTMRVIVSLKEPARIAMDMR